MKKILSVAILPLLALSSCRINVLKGEGTQVAESRTVKSFTNIDISVPLDANITVKEGATPSVQLHGFQNILKNIKTETDGNTLRIFMNDNWSINTDEETKAEIVVPSLANLSLEGAPNAFVHGNVVGPEFSVSISGAADAVIDNINVTKFSGDISGAGDIKLNGGKVNRAEYTVSGAGDIDAFPVQTNETIATVSGAGDGKISAAQKLEAHISGTGSIHYKGHPQLISDVSGVGSVTDAN